MYMDNFFEFLQSEFEELFSKMEENYICLTCDGINIFCDLCI